jgi:hypothetical protein
MDYVGWDAESWLESGKRTLCWADDPLEKIGFTSGGR